jgi:WD40 repeat protein
VLLFDTAHWERRHHLACLPGNPLAGPVAFSSNGRTLAAGSSQGIQWWDTTKWEPKPVASTNLNDTRLLAFSSDSNLLGTTDGARITLWDLSAAAILGQLESRHKVVWSLAISPTDPILAAGSSDGHVEIWDTQTRTAVNSWQAHALFTVALAFSPDGKRLASGGGDQLIRLWDAASLRADRDETAFPRHSSGPLEIATFRGHLDQVWCLAYASNGLILASGSQDGTAKLWRAEEEPAARSHSNLVGQLWFSPDGHALATMAEDLNLHRFDGTSMEKTGTTQCPLDRARIVSRTASPDGTRLAFLLQDGSCQIWDAWKGQPLATNQLNRGRYGKIALARDNQTLAVESLDGDIVEVWELSTRKRRFVCKDAGPPMIFVDNGRCLVSPGAGFTIKLWDTMTGRQFATFEGHKRWITTLAASPDERFLASGSSDSTARLWDLRSGREIAVLKGHLAGVESLAFSADGRTLATGGYDATLRLWSVATHKEMVVLKDSNPAVGPVQFSPDGNTLAAAGAAADAEVRKPHWRLWRVPALREMATRSN